MPQKNLEINGWNASRDKQSNEMKTFPGLQPTDYMKVIVFGCQVIGKYIF